MPSSWCYEALWVKWGTIPGTNTKGLLCEANSPPNGPTNDCNWYPKEQTTMAQNINWVDALNHGPAGMHYAYADSWVKLAWYEIFGEVKLPASQKCTMSYTTAGGATATKQVPCSVGRNGEKWPSKAYLLEDGPCT